jgi:hypothetical protein
LKTPETTSVSATADVPTVEKPENGGVAGENIQEAPDSLSDASVNDVSIKPNGAAPARKPPRSNLIKKAIQEAARRHPDWDAARIGKECGRTESR